jgi:hypothetical protein
MNFARARHSANVLRDGRVVVLGGGGRFDVAGGAPSSGSESLALWRAIIASSRRPVDGPASIGCCIISGPPFGR